MADVLTPIVDADGIPVYYPIRTFRSVETPIDPATIGKRYGWNLEAEHTEKVDKATNNEHRSTDGVHYLLSVPMVYCALSWSGSAYSVSGDTEDRGLVQRDSVHLTISAISTGIVEVTLSSSLPSAYLWLREATDETDTTGASPLVKKIMLHSITSDKIFRVKRWAGDPLSGAPVSQDGSMAFYVGAF